MNQRQARSAKRRFGVHHSALIAAAAGLAGLAGLASCGAGDFVGTSNAPPGGNAGLADESAAGNYLAGRHAQRRRDFATASGYLRRAASENMQESVLQGGALQAMIANGETAEAASFARLVIAAKPGNALANMVLIVDAMARGESAIVSQYVKTLPKRGFSSFVNPLFAAWAMAAEKNYPAAMEALKPLRNMPGLTVLHELHAGFIQEMAGNFQAAGTYFRSANAATREPALRVVLILGGFLERHGKAAEARKLYQSFNTAGAQPGILDPVLRRMETGKLPPMVIADARHGLGEGLFNIAGVLRQEGAITFALMLGRMALHLYPDHDLALAFIGSILQLQDRTEASLEVFRKIPESSLIKWSTRLHEANNLERLKQIDAAADLLREMADERPASPQPWINLGDLLRAEERFGDAVGAYDEAVKRIDKIGKAHWSLLYSRGIALERSKQWQRAEQDFSRALELQPEQPYVLNYLGYSWVDQGINLVRAQKMIERAVQLRPNDGYIVDSLGWVFYRLKRFEESVIQLERASVLRPQDPLINDHLGDAYWMVGRRTEARYQWDRALVFNPDEEIAAGIRIKLRDGLAPGADGQGG